MQIAAGVCEPSQETSQIVGLQAGSLAGSAGGIQAKKDQHFFGLIKQSWLKSGGVYGYRKVTC
ncbi:MAG: transposase [Pseudomonadota bacterium]|nr:transposase [Pseudomonadota bacterium]